MPRPWSRRRLGGGGVNDLHDDDITDDITGDITDFHHEHRALDGEVDRDSG